jgi:hypothetical protein
MRAKVNVTTSDNRLAQKKSTPIKVGKKKSPTRPPRRASAMPAPQANISTGIREVHDPKWDLETLTKAEQIKSDGKRHSAAVAHGKEAMQQMAKAIKIATKDV